MTKKAIIIGASGLIGSKLLAILCTQPDYSEILVIARKKTRTSNTKITQLIIDFEYLDHYTNLITGDVVFCCMGTTKSQTPNLKEYRKIDHDYPVRLAEIALKNGIDEYHFISAIGANSESSNFYTKMKGNTEEDLKKIGLKSLHIYEPSVLIGYRKKSRPLERIAVLVMKIINPFLIGRLKKYKAIQASDVAKAMYKQSLKNKRGVFIYTSDKIKQKA
ncbi:NAD(P)H-binding protein [Mucilaginibacter sp. UYCu711]|uniref:NAD(P)H-binding protein n=1 Tax=Mucilaginibacter sp. UYCu711 TaxID=3156339 RepID=UPI003D1CFAFA